jgi:bifunctional non-homologous end joining protein LigD
MSQEIAESIALFYKEGTSDKEYRVVLNPVGNGLWTTSGFNGRRGATLKEQKKTAVPVDYATAKKAYDQTVSTQKKKGYTTDTSGAIYQSLPGDRTFSGFIPQLLNGIRTPADLEAVLLDTTWWVQEKHDGERRPIRWSAQGSVEGLNKEGVLSGLPMNLVNDVKALGPTQGLLDGEVMGERYVAFDLLELNGEDLRSQPYHARLARLEALFEGKVYDGLEVVRTAKSTKDKRILLDELRKHGAEGATFKKADAPYAPGRPASGGSQMKYKFQETCTVQVSAQHATKRSVALQALADDGKTFVKVGNLTIPANARIPAVGALLEVQYLYMYRGGSLFQPTYQRERTDQSAPDRLSQFKYKSEHAYGVDADETGAEETDTATPAASVSSAQPKRARVRA